MSAAARFSGVEGRRSTRIDRTVPLIVMGQTKLGLSFQERTSAVSVNLHGCRYPSRHDYSVGSWVGLQVLEPNGESAATIMRAQVRSIHPPMSPRELYQIGVELEAPSNVWNVPAPPDDWQKILGASGGRMQMSSGRRSRSSARIESSELRAACVANSADAGAAVGNRRVSSPSGVSLPRGASQG